MCTLADIQTYNNNTAKVADVKKDYILNIIAACNSCTAIKKVVLFGSSTSENCKQSSDIDIAVFGNKTKAQIFKSKSYRNFINKICSFGYLQDYIYNLAVLIQYAKSLDFSFVLPTEIDSYVLIITDWEAGSRYDLHFSVRIDTLKKFYNIIES